MMEPQLFIGIDGGDCYNHVEAEVSDLLFAVRRGVESGTIKGEVVETVVMRDDTFERRVIPVNWRKAGTYIVIGPVSDGDDRGFPQAPIDGTDPHGRYA